ncbi:MAG: hypothetical protein AAF318_10095, partial [Pseudomonadota bacterium]
PPPVPRAAPRVPAAVRGPAAAPAQEEPVVVAALPDPRGPATTSDVPAVTLGYAPADEAANPSSALGATAAIVPQADSVPAPSAASSRTVPILSASLSPVRGASPILIAEKASIDEKAFSDFTAPDRFGASRGGLLLADGFLGAPSGFAASTEWPETSRFTGLRITVFASPRT